MGPFVGTDGVTPDSSVVIGNADQAEALKANGAATVDISGATMTAVTGCDGWYDLTLTTSHTDTVGTLEIIIQDSSEYLPVYARFYVIEESVYDAMYASAAAFPTNFADLSISASSGRVDVASVAGTAQTAGDLADLITTVDTVVDGIDTKVDTIDGIVDDILTDTGTTLDTKLDDIQGGTFNSSTDSLEAIRNRGDAAWTGSAVTSDSGTAQAGSASTITLQSGASSTNDTYNGQLIYISSGTGAGQSRAIGDYVGSTKVATIITDWATTPDATSVYAVYPDDITEISDAPTAAAIADAVWDENTAGHTSAGTFGEQLKNDVDAILVDTSSTLDTKLDTIDTSVAAVLVDTAEIGSAGAGLTSLASATDLSTLDGKVDTIDTNVDAVLVDTGTTLPGILGTPADTDLSTDISNLDTVVDGVQTTADAIETDTQDIQSRLPASLNNGVIPADVQRINDSAVTGDGDSTPWDAA